MNIYVGNLPYGVRSSDLEELFAQYGTVVSAKVIADPDGRSKGFGFVEVESDGDGEDAIAKLNGYELSGRKIVVNQARPKR